MEAIDAYLAAVQDAMIGAGAIALVILAVVIFVREMPR
jgi:hypothetical protein